MFLGIISIDFGGFEVNVNRKYRGSCKGKRRRIRKIRLNRIRKNKGCY